MAKTALLDCRYFVGAVDLTGQTNRTDLDEVVEEKDVTTFGSGGAREFVGGLETITISAGGFVDYGHAYDADLAMWSTRRALEPHTWGPSNSGAAVAAPAYLTKALRTSAKLFTQVGEVLPWELAATGTWPLARGAFLYAPTTAVTATGDGTAVELSAVSSSQYLFGSLHVLAVSGTNPTLDAIIESDVDANFDGSETTRITFTQATAVGGQILRTAGPITDTFYRVSLTVGGTGSPSFTIAVAVGIGVV